VRLQVNARTVLAVIPAAKLDEDEAFHDQAGTDSRIVLVRVAEGAGDVGSVYAFRLRDHHRSPNGLPAIVFADKNKDVAAGVVEAFTPHLILDLK
jgi:hypothetical protein